MSQRTSLMIAAENDAVAGAKVGGIADVLRDIAPALAARDCTVDCLLPSHGFLHRTNASRALGTVTYAFAGRPEQATLLELEGRQPTPGVRHLVLHHPSFAYPLPPSGRPALYWADGHDRPFATDSIKFAHFSAAVVAALRDGQLARPDVLHCHDWHAGTALALLRYDPANANLTGIRTVFTIHNLALQGIRPLRGDISSLEHWFPRLDYDAETIGDPRYRDPVGAPVCYNPMRAGIRLAERVHAVSPTYATEILWSTIEVTDTETSETRVEQYGGMGLEADLQQADDDGRLVGILNGTVYDQAPATGGWPELLGAAIDTVQAELDREPGWPGHRRALDRLVALRALDERPPMVVTSVTRITDQKAELMMAGTGTARQALGALLGRLDDKGVYLLCGTGQAEYEEALLRLTGRHRNFIFIKGFAPALADLLYAAGDLFLMPSSFEPCGISQMMAMRVGQPCLVHAVGGLKDTVIDGQTGFCFEGDGQQARAAAMVETFERAMRLFLDQPAAYRKIRQAAAASRFEWSASAAQYLQRLYDLE